MTVTATVPGKVPSKALKKAMIFAAGLGTRLQPLTNDRPKALVEVAGHPMLEITLRRLAKFGIREVIVNVHHFADQVVEYLNKHDNLGMRIEVSREDVLLDTGGGLKKAAWFFLEDPASTMEDEPFLLHNVDVLSNIDLDQMLWHHQTHNALATLAVQSRETSRYLLFDGKNELCGRRKGGEPAAELVRQVTDLTPLAFCGIHVISTRLLKMLSEQGVFSIITSYLRLARQGAKIQAFRCDGAYWRDLGRIEAVRQASEEIERGGVRI
jgi:mannose-1-phosphate guanylyltransferase